MEPSSNKQNIAWSQQPSQHRDRDDPAHGTGRTSGAASGQGLTLAPIQPNLSHFVPDTTECFPQNTLNTRAAPELLELRSCTYNYWKLTSFCQNTSMIISCYHGNHWPGQGGGCGECVRGTPWASSQVELPREPVSGPDWRTAKGPTTGTGRNPTGAGTGAAGTTSASAGGAWGLSPATRRVVDPCFLS